MLFGDLCCCCWTGSRNFTSPRALKPFEHRVQTVWALPTAAQECPHPFLALPVLSSMASSLVGAHGAGRVPRAGIGSRVAAPHSERCSWVQGPSAGCPSLGWDEGSGPWAGTGVGGLWGALPGPRDVLGAARATRAMPSANTFLSPLAGRGADSVQVLR